MKTQPAFDPAIQRRAIHEIAHEIARKWKTKDGQSAINYAAKPYLDAMYSLDKISDNYMEDSGRSVVAYFLSNATTWRGPDAKRIKAELNSMLKAK